MSTILLAALIGLGVAVVGAWKDTLWEPFSWRTFWRSPAVTVVWAGLLSSVLPGREALLIALAAASLERLSVETWKGLFRKRPSKFARRCRDSRWFFERIARRSLPISSMDGGLSAAAVTAAVRSKPPTSPGTNRVSGSRHGSRQERAQLRIVVGTARKSGS